MPIGDRIKQLRSEAGLSQAELAQRVGSTDAREISRYENGRITPSLDAVVRIAQALDVSIDYLAIDDMPRRPLHVADTGLAERLKDLDELDPDDRASLLRVLDALLTRSPTTPADPAGTGGNGCGIRGRWRPIPPGTRRYHGPASGPPPRAPVMPP